MAEYRITSSSLLPSHPFVLNHCVSHQSKASSTSSKVSQRTPSSSPSSVLRISKSVTRLHHQDENDSSSPPRSRDRISILPRSMTDESLRATFRKTTRRSSWGNDISLSHRPRDASAVISDTGPLEDVDLNSIHLANGCEITQQEDPTCEIRPDETEPTLRHVSDVSQDTDGAKNFVSSVKHPFSNGRPFRKWIGTRDSQQPTHVKSLTFRESRWNLDDAHDEPEGKPAPPRHRAWRRGHQNSSSYSNYSLASVVKAATASLTPSGPNARSHTTSRRPIRKSDSSGVPSVISSTKAEKPGRRSLDYNDRAELERAMHRQNVLTELIRSEEGYIADLKVLLHVRNPEDSKIISILLTLLPIGIRLCSRYRAKTCPSRTTGDIIQRCSYASPTRGFASKNNQGVHGQYTRVSRKSLHEYQVI